MNKQFVFRMLIVFVIAFTMITLPGLKALAYTGIHLDFQPHVLDSSLYWAEAGDIGDMDGDGDVDMVATSYYGNVVVWYENTGDLAFTRHSISNGFGRARIARMADMDQDGDVDVIGAGNDGGIAVWVNSGTQTFTQISVASWYSDARYVDAADIDGDGDNDLLSTSEYPARFSWWENVGGSQFTEHRLLDDTGVFVAADAGDVDQDGDIDLLLSDYIGTATLMLFENDGNQNFTILPIDADYNRQTQFSDINSDGKLDIVAISDALGIAWFKNLGEKQFEKLIIDNTFSGALWSDVSDINNDGYPDILGVSQNTGTIAWWESNHAASFTKHVVTTGFGGTIYAQPFDINKDGRVDIFGTAYNAHQATWWEQQNAAPIVSPLSSSTVFEGSTIELAVEAVDPNGDELSYTWDFNNDGLTDAVGNPVQFSAEGLDDSSSPLSITVIVTDSGGLSATTSSTLQIANQPPIIIQISGPSSPVLKSSQVIIESSFTDPGALDVHQATINWGDGTISDPPVTEAYGSGTVTGSHAYDIPGVYTVEVTIDDMDGGIALEPFSYVVVYDPTGGFVTGGGWIQSPVNDDYEYMSASDKANFGFVSKYHKGASLPTGNTKFVFSAGDMIFQSDVQEWLVVTGSNYAKFKGSGTINNTLSPNGQSYHFQVWAGDGKGTSGEDTFRIKIWWEDNGSEIIVYDNGMDQIIGGGSIVVHR